MFHIHYDFFIYPKCSTYNEKSEEKYLVINKSLIMNKVEISHFILENTIYLLNYLYNSLKNLVSFIFNKT